uniref:Tripartite motif-containing protein 16-like n=1 Tax=Sinocyclocheilus rhinocerous TaxID=307959 RepID=A0A673LMZ5_9TELE
MAEAIYSQDEFMCPVCLDLLKDPVTIQCGHSYCENCITARRDQEDQMRVYSCPQCRQTFSPRPALSRNAGDVQCDVCTGRKYKAVKSCLVCLNSYCQNHLEQHESWFRGKRHNLTEATGQLQEMICQKHEKLLEVFCRTDQKYICMLCTIIEHKNHDFVSAAEQTTEKQHSHGSRNEQQVHCWLKIQAVESHKVSLEHATPLTLDLNTVNKYLSLSESNRVITFTYTVQSYLDHPDRFDVYRQVLCRESVCGRCYWELEWRGRVYISVSYKSISRKGRGDECWFGFNDQSWSLICTPSSYSFIHNKIQTVLPVESISSRIGVFVDHSAGTLSFYSVSDTMSLIHTVQTTCTQPLYPGFGVKKRSSVKLC